MSNLKLRVRLFCRYFVTALSPKVKFSINVISKEDTLAYIIQNQSSVVRFGDGEVQLMCGGGLDFQVYDQALADRLTEILSVPSSERFVVCVPDVFHSLGRYRLPVILWWEYHLKKYQKFYRNKFTSDWYGSAFISRPYIDWTKKERNGQYFKSLKKVWDQKDILIVEGRYSRSGVGNDLFANARSLKRIICPSGNAFCKYEIILQSVKKFGKSRLILAMLGPTAKVLCYDLFCSGYRAIDLGHIDSEYEWFLMGAKKKAKLKNKHSAEFNLDNDIEDIENREYQQQIIEDLSDSEKEQT